MDSSPFILLREMDNLFRSVRNVPLYLDVLVTSTEDEGQLQNLHTNLA